MVNVLSLAKVQMLGGNPRVEAQQKLSDHLRTAYRVHHVTGRVDLDGAEGIADYGLQIASFDGLIGILDHRKVRSTP